MKITIHTDASPGDIEWLRNLGKFEVEMGMAGGGLPDCMYGWGEPADTSICEPHIMIHVTQRRVAKVLLKTLVGRGFQAVPTSADDFSVILNIGAIRYNDSHEH